MGKEVSIDLYIRRKCVYTLKKKKYVLTYSQGTQEASESNTWENLSMWSWDHLFPLSTQKEWTTTPGITLFSPDEEKA